MTVLGVPGGGALAATVNDIHQAVAGSENMTGFDQTDIAQSYTAVSGNSVGAGIRLGAGSAEVTATLSLWSGLPGAGGQKLAEGQGRGGARDWLDVFWAPVVTEIGGTFVILMTGDASGDIAGSPSNVYAGGHLFSNAGFQRFPSYDFAFRTFTDPDFKAVPAVPAAPSGLLLLSGVLAGFSTRVRRGAR
ncbi:hypothetical protein [Pseudooceanicola batsensis]|uniref:hypothetical protein n=1 Tax=Pseudooceanicola batsensis TaxID=314255 RepID=UPI0011D28DF6|nr:hypothetical protein [Pseudooceanicola batsensis]